ncbi:MAG: DUF4349 domain-containing protein [Sphingomonadaceae bacterium]|nr:DUF4349 domain-containing protein [Sphingomonadaceae bacterium]
MLLLAGCGSNSEYAAEESASYDVAADAVDAAAEAPVVERLTVSAEDEAAGEAAVAGGEIAVSLPQIAYVYAYGFRVDRETIPVLQKKHADLCENMGPTKCRILSMEQSGGEGSYTYGSLNLAVAADSARAFGTELAKSAESAGGEQVNAAITGEDLSKQIVDTEARLRARTVLRDRLMEVLRSRKGTVAELVEAERGVAQVNEEIDQARSWLVEMKGRVAFSRMNISYESGQPQSGGFLDPIRSAVGSIGTILGVVIAALIVLATIAIPLGLLVWGILYLRRQWRARKQAGVVASSGESPDESEAGS